MFNPNNPVQAPTQPVRNAHHIIVELADRAAVEFPRRITPDMSQEQKFESAKSVLVEATRGHGLEIARALRQSLYQGVDLGAYGRLAEYPTHLVGRASNAYSIGAFARQALSERGLAGPVGEYYVQRLFDGFYKAANLQGLALHDPGERVSNLKESRAFKQGISGVDNAEFVRSLQELYDKNLLQLDLEEDSGLLQDNELTLPAERNPFPPLTDDWVPDVEDEVSVSTAQPSRLG
jgi:hypothetical protein